jgi:hypothetical protein
MMPWAFGEAPLPQTRALASALRRITALAMALEAEEAAVDDLLDALDLAEQQLGSLVPPDPRPRVGAEAPPDGRVYIDHSCDIGTFNPCFPEYTISVAGHHASGTVSFPIAYEGPPGLVHGGFLAVFFDSVIQHHNCDVGVAGKTRSLDMRYRRPTPLETELIFTTSHSVDGPRVSSVGCLLLDGVVLCEARMDAVAGDRSRLPDVSPRRAGP